MNSQLNVRQSLFASSGSKYAKTNDFHANILFVKQKGIIDRNHALKREKCCVVLGLSPVAIDKNLTYNEGNRGGM
jgi:hypothetical protein